MANGATDKKGTTKPARQPISTHRAFPPIVALWFAALLGLGSLVVPVHLVETLVTATGIPAFVPATAPPLGFTARALIALVFLLVGAVSGLVIARQVAKLHRPASAGRNAVARVGRKPISAHSELGEDGFDGHAVRGRRSLAMQEDDRPSEFLEKVPLPGHRAAPEAHDGTAFEAVQELELTDLAIEDAAAPASDTIGNTAVASLGEAQVAGEAPQAGEEATTKPRSTRQEFLRPKRPEPVEERQMFRPIPQQDFVAQTDVTPAQDAGTQEVEALPEWHEDYVAEGNGGQAEPLPEAVTAHAVAAAPTLPAALENEQPVEQVERQMFRPLPATAPTEITPTEITPTEITLAEITLAEITPAELSPEADFGVDFELGADPAPDAAPETADQAEVTEMDHEQSQSLAAPAPADSKNDAITNLDDLGLVQLAMRLGASIERRRALREARQQLQSTAAIAQPPLAKGFGIEVEEEMIDDAADAMAAFFGAQADAHAAPAAAPALPEAEAFDAAGQGAQADPSGEGAANPLAGFARLGLVAQFDDEDEDDGIGDIAASLSLPLANRAALAPITQDPAAQDMPRAFDPPAAAPANPPRAAFAEDVDAVDDIAAVNGAGDDGEDYGSLLALHNPFQKRPAERVRIEDEPEPAAGDAQPTVVFPAEVERKPAVQAGPRAVEPAAPSPVEALSKADLEENERALREALLNLQRMSGAA